MDEQGLSLKRFVGFEFFLKFDRLRIANISRMEQLQRSRRFFERMGIVSPLLANWYRGGKSIAEGLRFNVMDDSAYLLDEVNDWPDPDDPLRVKYVLWNGEPDILKGGLSIDYDSFTTHSSSAIRIEDIGGLVLADPNIRKTIIEVIKAAVELWPEIRWATAVPQDYYFDRRVFQDRETIGWIGFCPHTLKAPDFPDADELIDVPERGTIVVSCPQVMDQDNLEHAQRVGDIDIKLMKLGYLPMFPG